MAMDVSILTWSVSYSVVAPTVLQSPENLPECINESAFELGIHISELLSKELAMKKS